MRLMLNVLWCISWIALLGSIFDRLHLDKKGTARYTNGQETGCATDPTAKQ